MEKYPSHVVAKWLGHSPKVAAQHYKMSREHHFDDVVAGGGSAEPGVAGAGQSVPESCSADCSALATQNATQNATQQASAPGSALPQETTEPAATIQVAAGSSGIAPVTKTGQVAGTGTELTRFHSVKHRVDSGCDAKCDTFLRYCARPPFALERLSVSRGADGQIARIRYVLPRHKAANWVGPSRSRKTTRPGAHGVVDLSPFEFLDRLADLVPPPRKHRHRYHGVFAPNHKLRRAVTSLAIGNVGKRQEAVTGGHGGDGHATEGCCDANPSHKPRSHDTSRIAWAKLMARVGEEFPLACPTCGGDIRRRGDGRQEPAHFEAEVRKREKARMASPA